MSYDRQTGDVARLALLACGGNARLARRRLAEQGIDIPERTLRQWRGDGRSIELNNEHGRELENVVVAKAREIALSASEGELEAIARFREDLKNGNVKDAAKAAQALAINKGINVDQVLKLTGRPTEVTMHANLSEIAERFAQQHPQCVLSAEDLEGTATEIRPSTVLPPPPPEAA